MLEADKFCSKHSGCTTDISNLKSNNINQWEELKRMNTRIDSIMTKLNVVLGGVVVACIMLVINLFLNSKNIK